MADDPSLRCGATPEQTFLPKESPSTGHSSPSPLKSYDAGDSPAAAPGQKRRRDNDRQFPLAILEMEHGVPQ
jgi:hypothetical protein